MTILAAQIANSDIEHLGDRKIAAIAQNSKNPSNMCVGSRLQVKRTTLGISRQELSEQLGIDRDDLNAYEVGARRISANLLLRIAKLLDVRPDYFFRDYTEEELEGCLESSVDGPRRMSAERAVGARRRAEGASQR
jgi:transcriptional regulator with XRE-family HTH domain